MNDKKQSTPDIDRALRIYLDEIAMRHMTVHFLGLPHLKEEGVLSLEQIYIPITFTDQYKGRDPDVPRTSLIELLKEHRRVVILGDPGTGKSTLIKHIAYSFARERQTPLQHHFGNLIPVPIILRDIALRDIKDADMLLESFWKILWRNKKQPMEFVDFKKALKNSKTIFLLDGLDEKGDKTRREHLRHITTNIIKQFPDVRLILTSRIIGYDEVPFDYISVPDKETASERISDRNNDLLFSMLQEKNTHSNNIELNKQSPYAFSFKTLLKGERFDVKIVKRLYIAPFSNDEIDAFVNKWYDAKEPDHEERERKIKNLKEAIRENQSILALARVPNLLTLMALVNFIYAHLPSGRGKLYDKITEAYLESIDKYRGILTYPVALETKKKWMAHVGFWMQERRTQKERDKATDEKELQNEILVTREELIEQFKRVMALDLGEDDAAQSAPRFLNYISERSGLLIPRGPDEYAFVHLSFQEYFAAVYLYQRVFEFDKLKSLIIENLKYRSWHETFIILFELLSISQAGACSKLLDAILNAVEAEQQSQEPALAHGVAEFLSELLLDLETGQSRSDQQRAVNFCVRHMASTYIDDSIFNNIKNLRIPNSDELRQKAINTLLQAPPKNLLDKTMLLAPRLATDSSAWIQQIDNYLHYHKNEKWNDNILADVMPWAAQSDLLLQFGISNLALPSWFYMYFIWFDISLSDILLSRIITHKENGPRCRIIQWLGLLMEFNRSNMARNRTLIRALARDRDWALDRARNIEKIINIPTIIISKDIDGWICNASHAVNMLYSTNEPDSTIIKSLNGMAQDSKNQPARLLGRVALISLGFGNRSLVEKVNREVAELFHNGVDPAQWPPEFGSQDPKFFNELIKEMQAALPNVFLFESDDKPQSVLLNPDLYDPKNPESKYFLMTPDKFWSECMQWLDDIAKGRSKPEE